MTRLIYHPVEDARSVSPIDEAIMDLVKAKPVKIACPYLGRVPLERIIDHSDEWQLLTDIEELLRSQGRADREWFARFLVDNASRIRHCRRLHAKVIVTAKQAIIGSANFTLSGLQQRAEMSVLLSDRERVAELNAWFSSMWKLSSQIDEEATTSFAESLPESTPSNGSSPSLRMPPGPRVNATLKPIAEMRGGRWTRDAYLARVAERFPGQLDLQTDLMESLEALDAVRYRGHGEKEATYHVVLPKTDTDIAWVFDDARIYARWSKLPQSAATLYKQLLGILVDTTHRDGSPKTDGCELDGGIDNVGVDKFIQTILAVHEAVDPSSATVAAEDRRAAVLEFLKSHPGQEFTASEILANTRVPKAVVFKVIDGESDVVINERNGKRFYAFGNLSTRS